MIKLHIPFVLFFLFATAEINAQVINAGVGGNTTKDLLNRIEADVLSQNPDLVILMVGTNDMLNSKKMISYEEYLWNLEQIIQTLKVNGSDILMMSSPPVDSAYLFNRHDKNLFKEAPNVKIDSTRNIVEKLARKYELHFLDLGRKFKELNVPRHNQDLFIKNLRNSGKTDGVHPTVLGYHFIASNVYQFFKDNDLLGKYKKIVCFGDSITHGGGSGKEENYPSFLSKLLEVNPTNK